MSVLWKERRHVGLHLYTARLEASLEAWLPLVEPNKVQTGK